MCTYVVHMREGKHRGVSCSNRVRKNTKEGEAKVPENRGDKGIFAFAMLHGQCDSALGVALLLYVSHECKH